MTPFAVRNRGCGRGRDRRVKGQLHQIRPTRGLPRLQRCTFINSFMGAVHGCSSFSDTCPVPNLYIKLLSVVSYYVRN